MEINDVFYLKFLPEVKKGEVYVPYCLNIGFNTLISGIKEETSYECEDVIIPTLIIDDQEQFNILLGDYVKKAIDFYPEDQASVDDKIKKQIAFLFANATYNDFIDPIQFLKRRIDFFDLNEESYYLGRSDILGTDLSLEIKQDSLENETPFKFCPAIKLEKTDFFLPQIKFGISNNKAYIYAIQNPRHNIDDKRVNRSLYKVEEGFNKEFDNYEIYEEGNLKDITPSFLLSLNMFVSYLNERGIKEVELPTILIERWNAKSFALEKKKKAGKITEEEFKNAKDMQEKIQKNLTEKLIRTLLRIVSHYSSMRVLSFPDDNNSSLLLDIDNSSKSNNPLLNESSELIKNVFYSKYTK